MHALLLYHQPHETNVINSPTLQWQFSEPYWKSCQR